jgi:hypothetical protein
MANISPPARPCISCGIRNYLNLPLFKAESSLVPGVMNISSAVSLVLMIIGIVNEILAE